MDAADQPLEPIPVAAQPVRFCSGCGGTWDAAWIECPTCAARRGKAGSIEAAAQGFRSDQRRVRSAIALYFTLLGVSIFSAIVMVAAGEGDDAQLAIEVAASISRSIIIVAWCGFSWRTVWPLLKRLPSPLWLLTGAALAVVTMLVASAAVGLLNRLTGLPAIAYLDDFVRAGYGLPAAVIVVCVQPAIFEELAFRGVILSALEPVIGPREALLVSALMFAILHLSIPSIPHLFLMGVTLAWLKQRTGSLYAGMIAHFTHNFLVLLSEKYGSVLPW